jgi:hypothetical protein
LAHPGNKLIYISKKEDKGDDKMISMVIFLVLEKENQIEGSYILQLKTKKDHYVGVGDVGVQKYRGNGIGRFLIELVKCYTYGVSTKLKSDVVLKSSNRVNDKCFKHIGFQEIVRGDNLIDVITEFDTKTKLSVQGKHKAFHLPHDTKIKHIEIVDPGQLGYLSFDDVIFHWSYEEVKSDMWTIFNTKNYMVISSTDQEAVCCTFDIGTSFHELFNNHYDHILKDSVFMFHPLVE